jgi:hypothetical protein
MIPTTRRSMSTGAYDKAIRMDMHNNVRAKMLSDPATYPLMLILGFAISATTGFGLWFLTHHKDVRVSPKRRNTMIRDWGRE